MSQEELKIRPLSKELALVAKKEYKEDEIDIGLTLKELKQWVSNTPHLADCVNTDDQYLVSFMRGCRFNMETVKAKLDRVYAVRSLTMQMYSKLDPFLEENQFVLKLGIILPLRKPLPDGTRVVLNRWGVHDPSKTTVEDIGKLAFFINEILLHEDDNSTVAGQCFIYDIQGGTMKLFYQLSLTTMKKFIYSGEKIQPIHFKELHFVNVPKGGELLFNVAKVFMSSDSCKKVFVNSKMKKLYDHIPADILPLEYGGTDGTVAELIDYWKTKIESYRDYFLVQQTKISDESKRVGSMDPCLKIFKEM